MKKILFVCTGNTCRSCMAEGIFNNIIELDEFKKDKYIAVSAGIMAFEGDTASENAVKVLQDDMGIDISKHKAKRITSSEVNSSDLIITMTTNHKISILSIYPEVKNKIYTLKEFINDTILDINDPYGGCIEEYRQCANDIKDAIDKMIMKLD